MVMEKHADFLRDFRGDTVHASTLRLLDELGLGDDFARMPHREIDTLNMKIQGTEVSIDVSRILVPHKNIALVPQWDLVELLDVQLNRLRRWYGLLLIGDAAHAMSPVGGSGSTWP